MVKRKKMPPEFMDRKWGRIIYRTPGEIYPIKKLCFIRHAHYIRSETFGLSPLGKRQAERLAKRFKDEPVDVIHHSRATRAIETAEIIAKYHGENRLRVGTELHEVNPPFRKLSRGKGQSLEEWKKMRARIIHDRQRIEKIFRRFFTPAHRNRIELIVCHGNVIRNIFLKLIGIKKQGNWLPATRNAAVMEIHIDSTGLPWLYSYEDVGHLAPNMVTIT
ncbi:MAG: histidine phosphatase family protein [Planctomycetota bacterium]|jgi:serine/threonine-protein phosphatase PGAM5